MSSLTLDGGLVQKWKYPVWIFLGGLAEAFFSAVSTSSTSNAIGTFSTCGENMKIIENLFFTDCSQTKVGASQYSSWLGGNPNNPAAIGSILLSDSVCMKSWPIHWLAHDRSIQRVIGLDANLAQAAKGLQTKLPKSWRHWSCFLSCFQRPIVYTS